MGIPALSGSALMRRSTFKDKRLPALGLQLTAISFEARTGSVKPDASTLPSTPVDFNELSRVASITLRDFKDARSWLVLRLAA
jgi:hypothetical protein